MFKGFRMRFCLLLIWICFWSPAAFAQQDKTTTEIIAIIGAELRICEAQGTIPNGIVLIQGETLLAVGDSTLSIPAGARTVDAKGCVITPGLIDARSKLWLAADSSNAIASDASLDIVDGIDSYSENWHEVLSSGVTTVYMQPSSKGSLGGYGAVVSVMPKSTGGVAVLSAKAGLQASLGASASNNRTRQQELERTKKILDAAVEYRKKWDEYEAYMAKQAKEPPAKPETKPTAVTSSATAPPAPGTPAPGAPTTGTPAPGTPTPGGRRGFPGGRPPNLPEGGIPNRPTQPATDTTSKAAEPDKSKDKPVKKPDREPAKEELVKVIQGEIPLRLEVNGPDDVFFALKLFESDALKTIQVVFEGLGDLRSAGKVIRDLKNPIVLGPWLELEQEDKESDDSPKRWGTDFSTYDGVIAIATNGRSSQSSKLLRAHAAKAISYGFSQDRALRAITMDAALALGVSDRIGSLTKGKRADIACFRGEPTNPANPVVWVMSGGTMVTNERTSQAPAERTNSDVRNTHSAFEFAAPLPNCFSIKTSRCWLEGRLQPAVLRICDGKIVGIEKGIEKDGVDSKSSHSVFDLTDAIVTPGLFSGHANFGLDRIIDPQSESDSSLVVAADGFARDFNGELKLVRSGLLRALLAPGSSNPISGNASLVRLGATEPTIVRDAAAKFVLSNNARNANRFPSSLAGQIQMVSQSLNGTLLPSRVYLPTSIEQKLQDRRLSILRDVASGKTVAIIESQSDAEILSALKLIETQKLNALLFGPKQLRNHIARIQKAKCTIVVQPLTANSFDWYLQDLVQATQAGIPICFAGESAEQLRLTASLAVAAGADHNKILSALCEVPIALLSPSVKAGLAIDGPADFVIWSDSPVNLESKPLYVLIDGQFASRKDN